MTCTSNGRRQGTHDERPMNLREIARALPISKNSTTGFTPTSIPALARAGKQKRARNCNGD
jgi:hypothetical protein